KKPESLFQIAIPYGVQLFPDRRIPGPRRYTDKNVIALVSAPCPNLQVELLFLLRGEGLDPIQGAYVQLRRGWALFVRRRLGIGLHSLQFQRELSRIDVGIFAVEDCFAQTTVVLEKLVFQNAFRQSRLRLKLEHKGITEE